MSRPSKPETPEPFVIAQAESKRPSGRAVLFVGVAGACALGVGAGLWARPGLHERQATAHAAAPPAAPAQARRLEIVVDSHPRPVGTPLNPLPPEGLTGPAPASPPAFQAPPAAPPERLIRTEAPVAPAAPPHEGPSLRSVLPTITAAITGAKLVLTKLERPQPVGVAAAPPPEPPKAAKPDHRDRDELARAQARELQIAEADAAKAQAHRAALAKAEVAAEETAKAEAARVQEARAKAHAAELARAEAAQAAAEKAQAHKLALAKAQAAKAQARLEAHRQELARVEAAKEAKAQAAQAAAEKLAQAREARAAKAEQLLQAKAEKAEQLRQAKAEKAEQLKLAKAQARAQAAQREEARLEALADAAEAKKRAQLTRLARALAHAVVGGHDRPAAVTQAKVDRKHGRAAAHDAQVQQASLKTHKHHEAAARAHARTEVVPPPPPSGLMRVSTPHCASRDPGEALVCADPGLSAAQRQLARAYQGARAAGVPDEQLEIGQQRWLAARSAAAREAPWAVRDVYMARIAELNGQAKEAQGGY
jgi:colicin import membrane protein